jgi:hypothetical protein
MPRLRKRGGRRRERSTSLWKESEFQFLYTFVFGDCDSGLSLVPEKENENENGGKLAYVQSRTVFTYLSYIEFWRSLFRFSVAKKGFAINCKFYPSLVLTLNSTPV